MLGILAGPATAQDSTTEPTLTGEGTCYVIGGNWFESGVTLEERGNQLLITYGDRTYVAPLVGPETHFFQLDGERYSHIDLAPHAHRANVECYRSEAGGTFPSTWNWSRTGFVVLGQGQLERLTAS